jgi:hypothetical protein
MGAPWEMPREVFAKQICQHRCLPALGWRRAPAMLLGGNSALLRRTPSIRSKRLDRFRIGATEEFLPARAVVHYYDYVLGLACAGRLCISRQCELEPQANPQIAELPPR